MTTICTGWHPEAWDEYAYRFIDGIVEFWPEGTKVIAYVEDGPTIKGWSLTEPLCIEARLLWDCDGAHKFIWHNKKIPAHCGKQECKIHKGWKAKDHRRGYTFRYDAVRFCKQMFIPEDAAKLLPDGEILAWFDADVVTFDHVPPDFIEQLLGENDLCYLGRNGYHSEIGFWAVRLNSHTRPFLESLAQVYRNGEVFNMDEWHSAFVFDNRLELLKRVNKEIKILNLSPNGKGHVWFQTPLGDYTDHLKGPRKKLGRSPERKRG